MPAPRETVPEAPSSGRRDLRILVRGQSMRVDPRSPIVVSLGMGVDSVGLLVGMRQRGIRPDLVLFSDPGSEHPETYAYVEVIDRWLRSVGFPGVTVVKFQRQGKKRRSGAPLPYDTLYGKCIHDVEVPSIAYGANRHSCSIKFKAEVMNEHVEAWAPALRAQALGLPVIRVIGYDDSPADRARKKTFESQERAKPKGAMRYEYWYPLQDWKWDRHRTVSEILKAGLPLPHKSACVFCPSMNPYELIDLAISHPDRAKQIIEIEINAWPRLEMLDGLWGIGTTGARGGVARPGMMTEFLLDWMLDGRAYQTLDRLATIKTRCRSCGGGEEREKGLVPEEVAALPTLGAAFRRHLPVIDLSRPDPAKAQEIVAKGQQRARELRVWFRQRFGVEWQACPSRRVIRTAAGKYMKNLKETPSGLRTIIREVKQKKKREEAQKKLDAMIASLRSLPRAQRTLAVGRIRALEAKTAKLRDAAARRITSCGGVPRR